MGLNKPFNGIKSATGTAFAPVDSKFFAPVGGTRTGTGYIKVTGLSFKPRTLVVYKIQKSPTPYQIVFAINLEAETPTQVVSGYSVVFGSSGCGTGYDFDMSQGTFTIPVVGNSEYYYWKATS